MLVGYMRVSTDGDRQVMDLQHDALLAAGVDERHLFEDHASGSRGDRTGLAKALAFLRPDDCLVVWKLDRRRRRCCAPSQCYARRTGRTSSLCRNPRRRDLSASVGRPTSCQAALSTDAFTHLRTGETVSDSRILMAGLLADGLNLGLTRMAEACSIASLGQIAWTADWHIRDETYALALRRLVNQQQREPFAQKFGSGTASSSDGQFFQAAGFGRDASALNAHYGQKPGFKVYTHLSDRYGPFYSKLIAATASEALHVLDALLYHQSEVAPHRHPTDGGGDSEHVFALCALLGFQFAPRIPGLKHRRLYSFGKPSDYPTLEPMIAGRINVALIRAHWSEILRIVASIRTGTVTASLIMRQLASYPRQNGVAAALRELGRLERTLFTLDWINDPELRRATGQELNKGKSRNSLARAVFIHRLGKSATAPTRTSSIASPASIFSLPLLFYGTRGIWSVPWPLCARSRMSPIICWPTCPQSAGSTST